MARRIEEFQAAKHEAIEGFNIDTDELELKLRDAVLQSSLVAVGEKDHIEFIVENWKEEGFSLKDELENRRGPFVEIAGPTDKGYEQVDVDNLDRKLYVSNIVRGGHLRDEVGSSRNIIPDTGEIDFQADAKKLPFQDGTIGALFASCLLKVTRKEAIEEAKRVLEDGGLFVFQAGFAEDIEHAKKLGFKVRELIERNYGQKPDGRPGKSFFNVIFQKEKPKAK